MSGAIYFLQGIFGAIISDNPKKIKQKKSEIIPIKKKKSLKNQVIILDNSEKKKTLNDLDASFRKAFSASSKLRNLVKTSGTDMEKFQLRLIHSQMKVIAKALENLKK